MTGGVDKAGENLRAKWRAVFPPKLMAAAKNLVPPFYPSTAPSLTSAQHAAHFTAIGFEIHLWLISHSHWITYMKKCNSAANLWRSFLLSACNLKGHPHSFLCQPLEVLPRALYECVLVMGLAHQTNNKTTSYRMSVPRGNALNVLNML